MLNHITEPTRITSTTSTLNDLSNDDNVVCVGVISDSVSDNLPIFISLQNQLSENVKTFRTTPNTKVDYALLRCLLEQTDFHITYDDDIDTECQNFTGTLTNILTKSTKTVNTLRYSTPICHWMTPSILTTLKRKDYWYNKWKQNKHNTYYQTQFKRERNTSVSVMEKKKREYYSFLIAQAYGDRRKIWDIVNGAVGLKSKRDHPATNTA